MKVRGLMIAVALGLTTSHAVYPADAREKSDVNAVAGAMFTEGEIRKVDKSSGKVTIKHGPLKNLDMPAMTMVFQVKDATMLNQVKAGDRINFIADKVNGAYTVMQLEVTK